MKKIVCYILLVMVVLSVGRVLSQQSNAISPTDPLSAHRAKAQEFLQHKDAEHAIEELKTVIALAPLDAEAHANLGFLYFIKGDCEQAVPELRKATQLRSGLWKQVGLLGVCEQRKGDLKNAINDLSQAYTNMQDDNLKLVAGKSLIMLYSNTGDLPKAASIVEELRPKHATDEELLYIAYILYTDMAGESMISLSLVDPNSAQMHMVMAKESLRFGDRVTAISHYRQAIKANPNMPGLHFELGEALNSDKEEGNKAEALIEYQLDLKQNPTDEKAECRLGEFALEKGDLDLAFNHYQRAAQLQPQEPAALLGLARVYISRKEPLKAVQLLEQIEKNDPTDDTIHFRLGTVYRQLGRTEDAKKEFADYQKYKDMKDKLRKLYKALRLPEGHSGEEKSSETGK